MHSKRLSIFRAGIYVLIALGFIYSFWFLLARPQILSEPALSSTKKMECVSYTPFKGNETPYDFLQKGFIIPTSRLVEDMSLLAQHFSCVRVYSAMGLEALPEVLKQHGMKLMLGIWVGRDPVLTQNEIAKAVQLASKHPDVVSSVLVGNEALLRQDINEIMLSGAIAQVKSALPNTPVSYADVWEFWQKNPLIASSVDFVTIHILPYWENNPLSIDTAVEHVSHIRAELAHEFAGKEIFIGETGWPSFGRQRQAAKPSLINQARFIRGFVSTAHENGWHYNLIEAFDQPWKRLSEGGVGGYWGLWSNDRQVKASLQTNVSNYPQWFTLAVCSGVLFLIFIGIGFNYRPIDLKLIFTLAVTSLLLTGQIHQYILLNRNFVELLQYSFVVYLHLLTVCLLLFQKEFYFSEFRFKKISAIFNWQKNIEGSDASNLFYWIQFLLMHALSLAFIFDPRYRMYPQWGFLVPAFLFFIYSRQKNKLSSFEGLMLVLALIEIITLIFIEKPSNTQMLAWGFAFFMLTAPLWQGGQAGRLLKAGLMRLLDQKGLFLGLSVALVLRYYFLESPQVAQACSMADQTQWCLLLRALGVAIHFSLLPKIGLIIAVLAYKTNRTALWHSWAQALAAMGLALYSVGWAAPVLILILVLKEQGLILKQKI